MNTSHLTPEKLLGKDLLPQEWADVRTAFVCFTPFPNGFKPYVQETARERYFLHSPNTEVHLCRYKDVPFIVVSEVYGFAVGATTVEELVHHGMRNIIAVGYAGAFNNAPVGQRFIAVETIADLPLAAHYGVGAFEICRPTSSLLEELDACIGAEAEAWGRYRVWTSNSLYRETPALVEQMRVEGCDAVNMDVLSIYACTPVCAREAGREVNCLYVGTVTDSGEADDDEWQSDLKDAVSGAGAHPHDTLVRFLVEKLLTWLD